MMNKEFVTETEKVSNHLSAAVKTVKAFGCDKDSTYSLKRCIESTVIQLNDLLKKAKKL